MTATARFACSAAAMLGLLAPPAFADPITEQVLQGIVSNYANAMIANGRAVGVAIGVVYPGQPLRTYTFGYADAQRKIPFATHTPFNIGSVTKVFTTNVLGQEVAKGKLDLSTPLSAYDKRLGPVRGKMNNVTLQQLGDFTAGIPDYAPPCVKPNIPGGCLPSSRPPISKYGVNDFVDFFQTTVPKNYYHAPDQPPPVSPKGLKSLPGPYVYSDFSTGLLGLLLVAPSPMGPLPANSVQLWFGKVSREILDPLGMNNTYLVSNATPEAKVAKGYSLATATAKVGDGTPGKKGPITAIAVDVPGFLYSSQSNPKVEIVGGGGRGAEGTAVVDDKGHVAGIAISKHGAGYVAPPQIAFATTSDVAGTVTPATANAVISAGHIVAIQVDSGGAGYTTAPVVTITGGGGAGAKAVAHVANGQVTAVTVTGGGVNYPDPLAVVIEPGGTEESVVPVWAPAGALTSTIADMTGFTAAALGLGKVRTHTVPPVMTKGFALAQKPYACAAEDPALGPQCAKSQSGEVGLAWAIQPADNGLPTVVTKNGGLNGFSTQIVLIPQSGIGVVAMANVWSKQTEAGEPLSDDDRPVLKKTITNAPADTLAKQIAYSIYYGAK